MKTVVKHIIYVRDHPNSCISEIAKGLGVAPATVSEIISKYSGIFYKWRKGKRKVVNLRPLQSWEV